MNPLNRLSLLLVLVLATMGSGSVIPAPAWAYTPEQALVDLNAWRAEAGEAPVVSFNPAWNEGCRLHNQYMALNGAASSPSLSAHIEEPGKPGYTPAGDEAGRHSVLVLGGELLPREAWVNTLWHRLQVLNPRLWVSGFDASNGYTCLWTLEPGVVSSPEARTSQLTPYPWPPNNATNVPLEFLGGEIPDPHEITGIKELGYLLSVNFNGPWGEDFAGTFISAASLTPDGAATIPVTISDTNNTGPVRPAFGLIPNEPLSRCTWYTAQATGYTDPDWNQYPFNVSWRFQTTCAVPVEQRRVRSTRLAISGRLAPRGITVLRIHGSPVLLGRTMEVRIKRERVPCAISTRAVRCVWTPSGRQSHRRLRLRRHSRIVVQRLGNWERVAVHVRSRPFVLGSVHYGGATASRLLLGPKPHHAAAR